MRTNSQGRSVEKLEGDSSILRSLLEDLSFTGNSVEEERHIPKKSDFLSQFL